MRSVLSTDKTIMLNGRVLSKYGDATNEVWNITMPSAGWKSSGKPVRIRINDSIDFIHEDNVYEAFGSNSVGLTVSVSSVTRDSKCSSDWFTFDYDFRLIPTNLVSPVGDYNIGYPAGCLYNDQNINLVVKYGPSSDPYKYIETVATFNSTSWGPSVRRYASSFTTTSQQDDLTRISWWVVTDSDESPIRLTYSYSDRYGQGFSGTKSQSWYTYSGIDSGVQLCSTTNFNYSSATGGLTFRTTETYPMSISNSKRIY